MYTYRLGCRTPEGERFFTVEHPDRMDEDELLSILGQCIEDVILEYIEDESRDEFALGDPDAGPSIKSVMCRPEFAEALEDYGFVHIHFDYILGLDGEAQVWGPQSSRTLRTRAVVENVKKALQRHGVRIKATAFPRVSPDFLLYDFAREENDAKEV